MANNRTLTVNFEGDARGLTRATDAAEGGLDDVDQAARRTGEGFDRATEGADAVDTRAMGFRDTMTGVQDGMAGTAALARGNLFEGFFLLGTGVGDLASGFANFLIPALKTSIRNFVSNAVATTRATAASIAHRVATVATTAATTAQAAAMRVLNAVMRANPILLIVGLLVTLGGALYAAYQRSETFRRIVQGAMSGVQAAFGWVLDRGADVLGWFRDLPGRVGGFLSGIGDAVSAPFSAAFDGIRSVWNSTVGGRGFSVPGWVPGIGGREFRIPTLHSGGMFTPPPGQNEGLALLRRGERVSTPGESGGNVNVSVMLSRRHIEGIAEVVVSRGNKQVKRAVISESGTV